MFRGTLENVLSGMKACFEFILNFEHPFAREKMFNLKSSSKLRLFGNSRGRHSTDILSEFRISGQVKMYALK